MAYTRARNQVKWETRKSHRSLERKIASEAKTNPKAFFRYANSKLNVKTGIADLKNSEGIKISEDGLKAEALNDFFSNVFTKEDTSNIPIFEEMPVKHTLKDLKFTPGDVQKILEKLKPEKAQGRDGMHPRVLKELHQELALPLYILFRKTLDEGTLPNAWKEGQVIPIFKKLGHQLQTHKPDINCIKSDGNPDQKPNNAALN